MTNTGSSVISGSAGGLVGVTPGSAITGFPPGTATGGIVTGSTAPGPAALISAQAAYTSGRNQVPTTVIGAGLGGLILGEGAYAVLGSATLVGNLTLNGGGNPNAVFIFDTASDLSTASGSTVTLTNGTQACNVFWLVGTSATLGTSSTFVGHVIAGIAISATTAAHVSGSLVALTGAVTLDSNTITNDNCATVVPPSVVSPAQTSTIDSVTPAACVTSGPTTVTLNGSFPTPLTSVSINGTNIPTTNWVQSTTKVTVTTTVASTAPVTIQLYNGSIPLLAVQTFICAPAAVVPIVPVVVPSVPTVTTATIHVIKIVNNKYGGTAVPGDFQISLRHWGVDVAGSPDVGMASPGRTYIVAPGTYVVGEVDGALFSKYINSFDIQNQTTNFIDVKAGDDITVVQTNTELAVPTAVVPPVTPTPPATTTGVALVQIYHMNNFQETLAIETSKLSAPKLPSAKYVPVKLGESIGIISIPKLSEVYPIVQGTDAKDLEKGVGHFVGSVMPGVKDNTVLAGHRDSVFSKLGKLVVGDLVTISTSDGTYIYSVTKMKIVLPTDKTVIVPTPNATLTLITCYPLYYIGSAPKRYIVSANLVNQ